MLSSVETKEKNKTPGYTTCYGCVPPYLPPPPPNKHHHQQQQPAPTCLPDRGCQLLEIKRQLPSSQKVPDQLCHQHRRLGHIVNQIRQDPNCCQQGCAEVFLSEVRGRGLGRATLAALAAAAGGCELCVEEGLWGVVKEGW